MSDTLDERLQAHLSRRPSPEVQAIMERTREGYMALVSLLDGSIPECREKSLALTALEESAMWGMKALVLTDPGAEVARR